MAVIISAMSINMRWKYVEEILNSERATVGYRGTSMSSAHSFPCACIHTCHGIPFSEDQATQ